MKTPGTDICRRCPRVSCLFKSATVEYSTQVGEKPSIIIFFRRGFSPIDKSEVVLLSSMVVSRSWPKSSSHFELVLADCAMCAVRNHPSVPLPPGGRRSRQISRSLTEPSVWVFRRWLTPLLRRSRPCSSSTIGRPVCTSLAIIRVPFTRVAAVGG